MIWRIVVVIVLAVIGLIALLSGILSNQMTNSIIRRQLQKKLPLVNGSQTLAKWSNVRVPIYMKYHILSIKNVQEVFKGQDPVFEEKGPYVFRQKVKKEVEGWNEDETLITYKSRKTYFFEPSMSNGNLSDVVFIPNLPVIGIVSIILEKVGDSWWKGPPARLAINNAIESYEEHAFINITVGELLFDGKKSEFLYNVKALTDTVGIPLPNVPENGKFCLMRGVSFEFDELPLCVVLEDNLNVATRHSVLQKNDSADGNWTVYTGKSGLEEFGSVVRWSNLSYLSCWDGDTCNRIDGTDGMMFHPFISKEESVRLFSSDVKRSLGFKFEKNDAIQGINAYKFTIPDEVFSAPRYSKRNKCFCVAPAKEDQLDVCAYNGMLDMHKCLNNAPLVISLPHFYSSNQSIINSTAGMAPSKDKHETFLKIDPVSGIVLSAAKRLQLNIHIRQSYGVSILENVKKGLYPIAWFEEGATMDEKSASDLKAALHDKIALLKKVFLAALIVGIVLILTAIILLILFIKADLRRKQEKNAHRNSYVYSNLKKTHDKDEIKNETNRI